MDSNYDIILQKLSLQYRIPYNVVKNIVDSQFEAIPEITKKIDLSVVKTKDDLAKMKTNFSFKYLMSMIVSFKRIQFIKKNEI